MLGDDARRAFKKPNAAQDLLAVQRMFAHPHPFLVSQLGRLAQDCIGHANLANVVQQRSELQRLHVAARQAILTTQPQTECNYPLRMAMRFGIACFQRGRQRLQG